MTATDNGSPPLSASQQFVVVVRDYRPDFIVAVGTTNLMAGESGAVPVTLASTLDVSSLNFQLGPIDSLVTNLALQPLSTEVTSATLLPLSSNTYSATFSLNPSQRVSATRAIGQLSFTTLSNAHSAVIPLAVSSTHGDKSDGTTLTNTAVFGGRLILVSAEPVLEIAPGPLLTLFGRPGANYLFEYRTNVTNAPWVQFDSLHLDGRFGQVSHPPFATPMAAYRAHEAPLVFLSLQRSVGSLTLTLEAPPGVMRCRPLQT